MSLPTWGEFKKSSQIWEYRAANKETNQGQYHAAAAAAKSLQSCPTLCSPVDGSPPGSPVPRILQARTLEWVAKSFSNVWKWKVKMKSFSRVRLFATPWTAAYQAPPSMGFSRQEYWSGLPLQYMPSPWWAFKHQAQWSRELYPGWGCRTEGQKQGELISNETWKQPTHGGQRLGIMFVKFPLNLLIFY